MSLHRGGVRRHDDADFPIEWKEGGLPILGAASRPVHDSITAVPPGRHSATKFSPFASSRAHFRRKRHAANAVMSSIMRRRSGLTALLGHGEAPVLDEGCQP